MVHHYCRNGSRDIIGHLRFLSSQSSGLTGSISTPPSLAAEGAKPPLHSATALRWWHGWLPLVVLPGAVLLLTPSTSPRWAFMWALAFAIFCGCKWLTWRRSLAWETPLWRHAGYLAAWPGLDAPSFLSRVSVLAKPTPREWWFAASKLVLGAVLLFAAARQMPEPHPYWVGWVGMIGMVMSLHFGAFHLLSCAWRQAGVNARPLMNWPLISRSLSEFWGRRWNTAFRDLTHRFLFRPLTAWLGSRGAVFAGFVFSGLIHEAVISLPARGGYGGPTLYFLIQGAGLLIERSPMGRSFGLGGGFRGWLFTMVVLIAPLGLLLHNPFVVEVIVPFMHALRAL